MGKTLIGAQFSQKQSQTAPFQTPTLQTAPSQNQPCDLHFARFLQGSESKKTLKNMNSKMPHKKRPKELVKTSLARRIMTHDIDVKPTNEIANSSKEIEN